MVLLYIRGLSKPFTGYQQTQFSLAPCFLHPKLYPTLWSLENQTYQIIDIDAPKLPATPSGVVPCKVHSLESLGPLF